MSAAIAAALALAEHYFPSADESGRPIVRIEDAHALTDGHIGETWTRWDHQLPYREVQRIGRAIGRRSRSAADVGSLQHRIGKIFADVEDDPVRTLFDPGPRDGKRLTYVYPKHGQDPLDLADSLLMPPDFGDDVRVADGTGWQAASGRGPVQLGFDDVVPEYLPPAIKTLGFTGPLPLKPGVLAFWTRRADNLIPGPAFRRAQVDQLLAGTLGHGAPPPPRVDLNPGLMTHLSAPTGYGKNVTSRAQCWQAVREGRTILLVLPGNDDVFGEAETLRTELAALNITATVAPFIAPGSRQGVALHAVGKADPGLPLSQMPAQLMGQFTEAGYSCAVNAQLDTGRRFDSGREPCTRLRRFDIDGNEERAACPFISSCDKFSLIRAALSAQIIITNHACLQKGMVKLPLIVDGALRRQMSAKELLLRLCDMVIIDEVDAYQSRGFEDSDEFELAVTSRKKTTPLHRIRGDLYLADAGLRLEVRGPLTRAIFLSEQLLDLVASGEICTEPAQAYALAANEEPQRIRHIVEDRRRWYLTGRWDRLILEHLLGVKEEASPSDAQLKRLRALMPPAALRPEDQVPTTVLPLGLRKIPVILDRMLTVDESGQWAIDDTKEELRAVIAKAVKALFARGGPSAKKPKPAANSKRKAKPTPPPLTPVQVTAGLLHAVMMKAWLSSLDQTIFALADHADALMASGSETASDLAAAVGHLDTGSVVPFGPLGRQISGYRFEGLDDPSGRPRLVFDVLRGDPHTETARLGDVVSLALAGQRRVVVGMSATGFMPCAARTHLMAWPAFSMPDSDPNGLTIFRSTPIDPDGNPMAVGGTPYGERDQYVRALARGYAPDLIDGLNRLAVDPLTAHRARALIAVNSYRQARLFAQALYDAALAQGRKLRIFVATPDTPNPELPAVCDEITLVTRAQFAQLASLGGEVLISPLPRTERGLNILTDAPSGKRESAITLIALAIRPVMPIESPAAMAASIASFAWRAMKLAPRPSATLAQLRGLAHQRLYELLGAPKRFTALPQPIKLELIAAVLVQVFQLAGRGRRGQTHVELHFLDGAFHDSGWGSDLPTLTRKLFTAYSPAELATIGRAYGYSGEALLDYARANHLRAGLRAGYPASFGRKHP